MSEAAIDDIVELLPRDPECRRRCGERLLAPRHRCGTRWRPAHAPDALFAAGLAVERYLDRGNRARLGAGPEDRPLAVK